MFFLDCLSLKYELIDIPSSWNFCLIDSKVQRNLRNSSYNERYNELKNAENILNTSELAGIVFSPDEKILFLNIYKPTMTLAIEGPWNQL